MNAIARTLLSACILFAVVAGCGQHKSTKSQLTSSTIRANRRAFDGAPPVIPHQPLGAACTSCHTLTGMQVPHQGYAPANPHIGTPSVAATKNCRQCHLFKTADTIFAGSRFAPLQQDLKPGDRLFPGAPPVIPHHTLMRENCQACHAGPAARPEIRCTHPQRSNCMQCHVGSGEAIAATEPKLSS